MQKEQLNLRKGPGSDYKLITTMPNNSVVTILDTSNATWYKVNFNENVGCALAQYISTTSAVAAIIKLKAGFEYLECI